MTKREVIWLLIRLAGLWFLWTAAENSITLMSTYLTAIQEPHLLSRSAWVLVQMFLQLGLHLGLALYCLGAGDRFFDLLSREKPDDGDSDSTGTSTLGMS